MRIGVSGAGNVGGALGRLWADKGHEIVFGLRDPKDPKVLNLVKSTRSKARAASVQDAASFGEVFVLGTPWSATEAAIKSAGSLAGKTLVDCTNALAPNLSGLVAGAPGDALDSPGPQTMCGLAWKGSKYVAAGGSALGEG